MLRSVAVLLLLLWCGPLAVRTANAQTPTGDPATEPGADGAGPVDDAPPEPIDSAPDAADEETAEEETPARAPDELPRATGHEEPLPRWSGDAAPPDDAAPAGQPLADGERRAAPNYDGRGRQPIDPREAWLWLPRILFFPIYLVSEYLIRAPISGLVTEVERSGLLDALFADGDVGVIPTFLFDFGLSPSVGLFFFWNNFLARDNYLRVRLATFGPQWLRADVLDRLTLDDKTELELYLVGWLRPDYIFHGIGPLVRQRDRTRFSSTLAEGSLSFRRRTWRNSAIEIDTSFRYREFDGSTFQDQNIVDAVARGAVALPPGFVRGYAIWRYRLRGVFDSRRPRPASGTGVRATAHFEQAIDLDDPRQSNWFKWGGNFGFFVDVSAQRILELYVHAELLENTGQRDVPFTELVTPGDDPLPLGGFVDGQLRGDSTVAMAAAYRWPVWVWLDAAAFVSVGNVFMERYQNFDVDLLRMSFGIGFRTVDDRDHSLSVLLAFGTDPFVNGANITSVRLTGGTIHGF